MVDENSLIEGNVKFRDGKKWKTRCCIVRKLSPAADCLTLLLYKTMKDRYRQSQTKEIFSLRLYLGMEIGLTIDKESNTIIIICTDRIIVLAFDTREILIQWQAKLSINLEECHQYLLLLSSVPTKSKILTGPVRMHIQNYRFCLTSGIPVKLEGVWEISNLRRYGVVENRFCFEGGTSCGKYEGLHVFLTDHGKEITETIRLAGLGKISSQRRLFNRKRLEFMCPRTNSLSTSLLPKSFSSFYIQKSTSQLSNYIPALQKNHLQGLEGLNNSLMSRSWTVNDDEMFRIDTDQNISSTTSLQDRISFGSGESSNGSDYTVASNFLHFSNNDNPYGNYDIPKSFNRSLNENYDVPKSFQDSGYESLNISEDIKEIDGCFCTDTNLLYATVDKTKKKARLENRNYENLKFVQSLDNYENSKFFLECVKCDCRNFFVNKNFQSKTLGRTPEIVKEKPIVRSSSADFLEDVKTVDIEPKEKIQQICIRRSFSIPMKLQNRDSTSSNDSGVYSGFNSAKANNYVDTDVIRIKKLNQHRHIPNYIQKNVECDSLQEITFKFNKECQISTFKNSYKNISYCSTNTTSSETLSLSSHNSKMEAPRKNRIYKTLKN